jgi:hypothetical protein
MGWTEGWTKPEEDSTMPLDDTWTQSVQHFFPLWLGREWSENCKNSKFLDF